MADFYVDVPFRRELGAARTSAPAGHGLPPLPPAPITPIPADVWPDAGAEHKHRPAHPVYRRAGKRLLDLLFVLLSAPVALPLIGLSAALLWIESGTPFYRQDRLGRGGRIFSIVKLRTMVRDADHQLKVRLAADPALRHEWETTQKLKNDPRITRVGSFLRQTSLDELPQLWNVLKGDMSIVGPRPMLPEQLTLYGDADHYFALRPGITGLWQVSKRNEGTFQLRVTLDAEYSRCVSCWQDLRVLVLTVGAVLRRTGY